MPLLDASVLRQNIFVKSGSFRMGDSATQDLSFMKQDSQSGDQISGSLTIFYNISDKGEDISAILGINFL